MKVPISKHCFVDLDAPVVPAYEVWHEASVAWVVWCQYCLCWHSHRAFEGFQEAPCDVPVSPYRKSGYNLSLRGLWHKHFPIAPPEDLDI